MNITVEKILNMRAYLVLASKLCGIAFCLYYIFHWKDYQVSWTMLEWAFPSYVKLINNSLAFIGTAILTLPLALILVSFIIPNPVLNIIAAFFGMTTFLLTSLYQFILTNSLTESSNFRLFSSVIHNAFARKT